MRSLDDIKDRKYLHINVGDLKEKLVVLARKKGLSLNSYIKMILTEHTDKEEKENER